MEKYFKTQTFEVSIGAARMLGETFEMNIAEVLETGGFKMAIDRIPYFDIRYSTCPQCPETGVKQV